MTGTYRFCPMCGAPLQPRVLRVGEPARLVCTNVVCGYVFYLDPKVAVGTIVHDQAGRIVLLRRAIEPGYGLWVFPGGYVDRGEEVRLAAQREAREEVGLDVRLDDLVGIFSYAGVTPIILVWAATPIGGTVAIDDESQEARWFEPAAIPWHELAFPSTRDALRAYLD